MTLTNFLKEQLTIFVENYKKYFKPTFGVAITFTTLCFVIAALLFRFSDFDPSVTAKQISLLSYFFHRYSKANTYSIVDITKTVFIFFVSLFSLGMLRLHKNDMERNELSFKHFFRSIKVKDIAILINICYHFNFGF